MGRKVMLQGTASNVGKSIIAAGLCRIFYQDGFAVSPFKSQNMALNSFITEEGLEIGRAQAFQAEAANIKPKADMNPILLKPTGNNSSQVVVLGKPVGDMNSNQYHDYKLDLIEVLKNSFEGLQNEHDIVVMEGAGSAAEINLMDRDISNMKMAEIADAPVILISDIDRGGVFASIVGTLNLMDEIDRSRVKGVIINKFRGRKELIASGVEMLEKIIEIPVLGVVPYSDIKIEDEDSVTNKFQHKPTRNDVHIEVIRTPYMSNFTDFDILETQEDVSLRYVEHGEFLSNPDIVIIPGTKNTIRDLKYIKSNGYDEQIKSFERKGGLVIGICGGYQMLGTSLKDPDLIESDTLEIDGLGLLDIETIFNKDKTTTQVQAEINIDTGVYLKGLKNQSISGYEIHMGTSVLGSGSKSFDIIVNKLGKEVCYAEGSVNDKGNVVGTYIHGVFDDIDFTRALLNNIRELKGLEKLESNIKSYRDYKNREYDKLAEFLREHLNIEKIYEIMR
ncbi:cobyric acid synthase [Metaclostridioides mangenotii]|uniref:cobyric acid synthase n=1 Tax=Metaclostridioides mangenotii TaxID=1540 RepID=UPI0004642DDE|nr:cobyric acid synthase [Clostridioides mangenotii]